MLEIKLVRKLKGKELVEDLKAKYKSLDNLKKVFEKNKTDAKLHMDLDDWLYFSENPDEEVEQGKIIYTNTKDLQTLEIDLLSLIKEYKPKSIRELAGLTNKDLTTVQRKVNKLNENGLIELIDGPKNSKIPTLNYDKIEISI